MKSWYGLIARSLNKRKSMSSHKTTFFVRSWVYINVMFIQRVICSTNVRQTRYKMTVITTWQHLTIVIQNSLNFHSVITSYNAFIITFNFSTQSHVCTHCCSYLYVLTCTFLPENSLVSVCDLWKHTHMEWGSLSVHLVGMPLWFSFRAEWHRVIDVLTDHLYHRQIRHIPALVLISTEATV